MELGIYTFGELLSDPLTGRPPDAQRRLKEIVDAADYLQVAGSAGGLFVGSPQQIIDKLLYQHELFGHQRYLGQLDIGGMPFAKVAEMIELLASQVAPAVRRATAPPTA